MLREKVNYLADEISKCTKLLKKLIETTGKDYIELTIRGKKVKVYANERLEIKVNGVFLTIPYNADYLSLAKLKEGIEFLVSVVDESIKFVETAESVVDECINKLKQANEKLERFLTERYENEV